MTWQQYVSWLRPSQIFSFKEGWDIETFSETVSSKRKARERERGREVREFVSKEKSRPLKFVSKEKGKSRELFFQSHTVLDKGKKREKKGEEKV